jgi:FHS family glucose/mannose:H+ symporter-like MFS transporter
MRASAAASGTEIGLIYSAAVIQGLALVTFPAASTIFTSPTGFGFDSTRYGTMFLPQVVLAVLASALAPALVRRWSLRRVLLAGFAANMVSMALLALSRLTIGASDTAFGVLLVATGALGLGFGATVMALNTYAETFFPQSADRAVLLLNALLGVGTALAPVLVAVSVILGGWWLLPILVAGVLLLIFVVATLQPLRASAGISEPAAMHWWKLPRRFWLYAIAVFLYGLLETLNGNWAMLYLSSERGASAQSASFALTAFWTSVTLGRLLIASVSRRVPARWIYFALTVVLVLVFQLVSRVQGETSGIIAFGAAGLACSAFLPLSISFGGKEFPQLSAVMAGELIAFYQLGYGVAAFGIGPLRDLLDLRFSTIFSAGSIVAALLAAIAFFVSIGTARRMG